MKTVVVTGASKGIGKSISNQLDTDGFNVILVARNTNQLNELAEKLNNPAEVFTCDLSNTESIQQILPTLEKHKNTLCGLINNAGIFIKNSFETTSISDWESQYKTNLLAPAILSKTIIPFLKNSPAKHKFIINISSTAAARPVPDTSAYGSLKSALDHLTKVMALELAPHKICVNAISPGIVDTPIHSFENLKLEDMDFVKSLHPLNEVGKPTDIASMAAFLAQDSNNWITGSNFTIDGGLCLK